MTRLHPIKRLVNPVPFLAPFVTATPAAKSSWFVLGDWQQVHENINRAFTENTATPGENSWVLYGVLILGLLLLAVGGYYCMWRSRPIASSDTDDSYRHESSKARENGNRQNRNWVRVPAGFDIWYAPVVSSETEETPPLRKARLIDISGGGCLLATDAKLDKGDKIRAVLNLPHGPEMLVTGRVVRLADNPSSPSACLAGIEFINLSDGKRDRINKWVFSRQQQLILRKHWMAEGLCLLCGDPLPQSNPKDLPYCARCLTCEQPSLE